MKKSLFILLSLTLGTLALGQKDLYKTMIKAPTFRNGMEEYLQAADLVRGNRVLFDLMLWDPTTAKTTLMANRRAIARESTLVINMVSAGNLKPAFEFRTEPMTADTLFPELAEWKRVCRVMVAAAYGEASMGNPKGASRILAQALIFSRQISGGTLIANLVGVACQSITLAAVQDLQDRLPPEGWAELRGAADKILSQEPRILPGLRGEQAFALNMLAEICKNPPEPVQSPDGESLDALSEETNREYIMLRGMTVQQRQAYFDRTKKEMDTFYTQLLGQFARPEAEWSVPPEFSTSNPILNEFFPVFSQVGVTALRERTSMRLLKLHAAIQTHRWTHNQLPNSLAEIEGLSKLDRTDPLSGKDFVYHSLSPTTYEVYSDGVKETGRIDLKYSRPRSMIEDEVGPKEPLVTGTVKKELGRDL
ncbi:MAG: hypothetical protein K8R88_02595 [Armatimonadetes bacterium]|nr:hypothetical protein [Armatimonadota bacterium]